MAYTKQAARAFCDVFDQVVAFFIEKQPSGEIDQRFAITPLNQADLSRAASANSGNSHQKLEKSCINSVPESIIEGLRA